MKYTSKYSPGKEITELQYIIELVCEKNAAQTGRQLPLFFWKVSPWDSFYKSQLKKCRALLTKYSSSSIIKALRDTRARKIYSLWAPWLPKIIEEYEAKSKIEPPKIENPEIGGDNFQRPSQKKTLADKLNEL